MISLMNISNGVKTGLRVGRDVADDDHPQNFLGRIRIFDPQNLSSARPDRSLEQSRQLFGFDPVWNPAQYLIASVGKVTVTTMKTHPTNRYASGYSHCWFSNRQYTCKSRSSSQVQSGSVTYR